MASSVIHMAVASEINKIIKVDNDKLLIGSIAPDISKQIGESKLASHFLDNENDDVPNIDRFLNKYRDNLSDDFVLGYFIHLYTDYLWFKYFLTEVIDNDMVKKLDGTVVKCVGGMLCNYIYNDYTNLNKELLKEYNIDQEIFNREPPTFDNIIKEIPMDKIKIIMEKANVIIDNSKQYKEFVFNMDNIKKFVSTSTELIIAKLKEINYLHD